MAAHIDSFASARARAGASYQGLASMDAANGDPEVRVVIAWGVQGFFSGSGIAALVLMFALGAA